MRMIQREWEQEAPVGIAIYLSCFFLEISCDINSDSLSISLLSVAPPNLDYAALHFPVAR